MFQCFIEEPVQDNLYELILDFDAGTFQHRYRKTAYEGGDGYYETIHRGAFTIESSGAGKKNSASKKSGVRRKVSSPSLKAQTSAELPTASKVGSPRKPDPVKYYVAKVDVRDYSSNWEPWDRRLPTEKVRRVGDTYHQELLFRYVDGDEIVNENVSPVCPMRLVK